MRKHFLILMLLTLLPLASRAGSYEVQVSATSFTKTWGVLDTDGITAVGGKTHLFSYTGVTLSPSGLAEAIADKLIYTRSGAATAYDDVFLSATEAAGTHTFTLSVDDGNKTISDFNVDGVAGNDDITIIVAKPEGTLTINKYTTAATVSGGITEVATSMYYNGGAQALFTGAAATHTSNNGIVVPVVYYLTTESDKDKVDAIADSEWLEATEVSEVAGLKATNQGNYYLYAKVLDTDNYASGIQQYGYAQLHQYSPVAYGIVLNTPIDYTGAALGLINTPGKIVRNGTPDPLPFEGPVIKYAVVAKDATAPAADAADTWKDAGDITATEVGFYDVYYKIDGDASANENWIAAVPEWVNTVEIKEVSYPFTGVATALATALKAEYAFNSSASDVATAILADLEEIKNNAKTNDNVELVFKFRNNLSGTWSDMKASTIADPKDGQYVSSTLSGTKWQVLVFSKDNGTYKASEGPARDFQITPGTQEWATAPAISGKVYDGTACTPAGDVTYETAANWVKFYYSDDKDAAEWNNAVAPTAAGTHYMKAYSPATKNFAELWQTDPIEFEITKANSELTTSPVAATGLIYDGTEQELLTAGTATNGTIYYSLTELTGDDVKDKSKWSIAVPKAKDYQTGGYTVWYKVFGNENYNDTEVAHLDGIAIAKKTITVGANEVKGKIADIWDFENNKAKISQADFLTDVTILAVDADKKKEILDKIVKVKSMPAFADLKLGENNVKFEADDSHEDVNYTAILAGTTGILNIEATPVTLTAPVAPATDLTYNGEDQNLIGTAGSVTPVGTVMYSLHETADFTSDATAIVGKNQGTYKVYYKVELNPATVERFYEYTEGTKNFTKAIGKKALTADMFVLAATEATFTGSDVTPTFNTKEGEPIVAADYSFTKSPEGDWINKGDYKFIFSATAEGNYSGTNIEKAFKINEAAATVAKAPEKKLGLIYTGEALDLVSAAEGVVGGTIKYSVDGGEFTTTVPAATDAKTYAVKWKVDADENHTGIAESEPISVTIAPKKLDASYFVFSATEATYNFDDQKPTFTLKEGEPITAADYDVEAADEMINAGSYTFKFTGKKNYTDVAEVTFTIKKKNQEVTAPVAKHLTYNGALQALVEAGSTDAEGVKYAIGEGEFGELDVLPEMKDAGTYTVKYAYVENDNFNPAEGGQFEVTIVKANIAYMLSNMEKTWDGETFTAAEVASVATLYAGELFGEDKYDVPFTLALPQDYKDAGTYNFKKMTVAFKEGAPVNYNVNFSGEAEVTINKADIVATDFTAPTKKLGLIYTGAAQDLVNADGVVTHKYEEKAIGTILYATEEDGKYTETIPQGTEAGDYAVWYKVAGDKNHNDTEATKIENTIQTQQVDFVLEFEDATVTYTGKDFMPTDLSAKASAEAEDALVKGTDYTLTIKKGEADAEELINVGTYVFTYTGIGNYEGSSAVRTITINKADLTEGMIPEFVATKPYTGKDQIFDLALEAEGLAETDYTVAKSAEEFKNAGKYTFTFTATETGNYQGEVEATFTITALEVIATAADAKKTYDGEAGFKELPVLTYSGMLPGDNSEFITTDAFTIENSKKDAGEYTFTVDASKITVSPANYTVVAANGGKFTIERANLAVNWNEEADKFTKVYGAEDPALTATAANLTIIGAVAGEEAAIIAGTTITRAEGKEVGSYAITLAGNGDVFGNYNAVFTGADDAFVITQAGIKVSIAALNKTYDGQAATITVTANDLVVTGLQNGDKKEDIFTTLPTATVGDGDAVNAGEYQVTLAGAVAADYSIEYIPATYTINPLEITSAKVDAQKVQQGKELDETAFTIEGIVDADADLFYVTADHTLVDMNGVVIGDAGVYANALYIAVDESVVDNYTGLDKFTAELEIISEEATVLADNDDFVTEAKSGVDVTFSDRTINAGNWNVCALPFAASVKQISDAFGYAAVDVLNEEGSTPGEVHFKVISSGEVPAYTPFIVKTTEDAELIKDNFNDVVFHNVNIEACDGTNSEVTDAAGNKFIGTFQAETIVPAGSKEYWYMSKGTWYDTTGRTKDVKLKPFRAYVKFAEGVESPRIIIEEPDGSFTSIDAVNFNNGNISNEGWYTVNGMKLDKAPVEKGVYIKNGKKVVIK
jgi:hypothetical protein